jgi:PhnB protein
MATQTKFQTQTMRPPKPADMFWMTPILVVRDVDKTIDFYTRAFGFEASETMPDSSGKTVHGGMKYKGAVVVMLGREGAFGCKTASPAASKTDCPVNLYVYCDDVDAFCNRAKKEGAEIKSEPTDMFWGDRTVQIKDLDGYNWTFATNVADFDPSKAPKM